MIQVLTTVFNYVTYGLPPFTLKAPIKVSGEYWGKNSGELELIVKDNELVCGVIDKAQFGKYGIVHTVQELYGPQMAGRLLSVFSRLFTAYLQVLNISYFMSKNCSGAFHEHTAYSAECNVME